jgi:hypothetical protein
MALTREYWVIISGQERKEACGIREGRANCDQTSKSFEQYQQRQPPKIVPVERTRRMLGKKVKGEVALVPE